MRAKHPKSFVQTRESTSAQGQCTPQGTVAQGVLNKSLVDLEPGENFTPSRRPKTMAEAAQHPQSIDLADFFFASEARSAQRPVGTFHALTCVRKLDVKEIHAYHAAHGLKLLKPAALAARKSARPDT
jgi:hypothetical protein